MEKMINELLKREEQLMCDIYDDECLICDMAERDGHTAPICIQQHAYMHVELEMIRNLLKFYGVE